MLTPDGTVKLMDFGIAKIAGEQKMTQVNKIVGTVEFMAPELLQGKDASAASDIYAAGVTLYELICGKLPFEADTDFNLMQAIMKQKIIQPAKFNATIPKALSEIVMKALDKNPAARFADAAAFQQALMNAFPNFRTINLASLHPATAYAQGGPATRLETVTGAGMETRTEAWAKPASALENVKQHVLENKKIYLPAVLLLLGLFITLAIVNNKNHEKIEETAEQKTTPENTGNDVSVVTNPPVDVAPVSTSGVDRREVTTETEKTPVDKPADKGADKTPEKTKEKSTEEKPSNRLGFKAAEEEPEKPAAKKDVTVSSKIEIQLYLQNDLGNAPERQDIPVTFSLSNAVVYQGVTIINKGATAKGIIKLGKIQTDVDITSITAANGEQIRIKADRGHGKRKEITSNRSYTAIIPPGTRINF